MELGWSEFSSSSTKRHTQVAFCGGGAPRYEGMFGYKKEAPGNLGAMRG